MTRALLVVAALSASCSPRRAAVIGGVSTLGAIGVGVPLANECTPDLPGDCGAMHYVPYLGIGALAGALLGIWILYEVERDERWDRAERAMRESREAVADKPAPPAPEVEVGTSDTRPTIPPRAWVFVLDTAGPIGDLPGSTLGGFLRGDGMAKTCVGAKRELVAALEARCEAEGFGGLALHTVFDEPCSCDHVDESGFDRCDALGEATCAQTDATSHVLGYATVDTRQLAIARARAEEHAQLACWGRGGTPGDVTVGCVCSRDLGAADDTCGCVADAACSPAGAVP